MGFPQSAHWVRVSLRTLEFRKYRLAEHFLQCFGALRNPRSWKDICSSAVKMKLRLQQEHVNVISVNFTDLAVIATYPLCIPASQALILHERSEPLRDSTICGMRRPVRVSLPRMRSGMPPRNCKRKSGRDVTRRNPRVCGKLEGKSPGKLSALNLRSMTYSDGPPKNWSTLGRWHTG